MNKLLKKIAVLAACMLLFAATASAALTTVPADDATLANRISLENRTISNSRRIHIFPRTTATL